MSYFKIKLVSFTLIILVIFSGCNNSVDNDSSSNESVSIVNPLTGIDGFNSDAVDKKPIALMISNIKQSLPQYGISQADMWFETLAEGGITRIMALFADVNSIPKTGPIRSVRDYYVDFAMPYNSILTHFGGSPKGYEVIDQRKVNNIDGVNLSSISFIQDNKIANQKGVEHSYFIDSSGINKAIEHKKYDINYKMNPAFSFSNTDINISDVSASNISIPFSAYTNSKFIYDYESNIYNKFQFGVEHMDAGNNKQIKADNVIVLKTTIKPIPNDSSGRISVDLISGTGLYFSKGYVQDINWKKGNYNSPFKFEDNNGNPIHINKGKTYISIVDNSANVSFE